AAPVAGAAAPVAGAADAEQTARSSYGAFLQGRYDDEISGWRYLETLGLERDQPAANEALAERDAGRPEKSLPLWIQATVGGEVDGFLWNQRGWSALALGRVRDARAAFARAIDRATATQTQAEANLGLGLAALADGSPKIALEPLRRAAVAGPYAIAVSAQLSAEASLRLRDKQAAVTYYRQALDADRYDREALLGLMRLLDKIGDNRGAWLTARRELAIDPSDEEARKILERNARYIPGDPDEAAGVRRIARPALDPAQKDPPLPTLKRRIRVGLYGAPDGHPATITRCYVMVNSPFKVTSKAYGVMKTGAADDQWQIQYRPDTAVVEVRDASGNILFISKEPFTFVPDAGPRGSVLIKSARIPDAIGVDIGDREERGEVTVFPNPWGFRLVDEEPLELYLDGVVSLALPDGSPPEAFRAEAVVARTEAAWAMGHRAASLENVDVLDDRSLQPTIGVSGEMRDADVAVRATDGDVLADRGEIARAPQHDDSGGRTADGAASGVPGMQDVVSVSDAEKPLPDWRTPLDFERFVHEPPPEGLYSAAAPGPTAATARWTRVLDARDLRTRVDQRRSVGRLLRLIVAGRTATGRVKALEVVGPKGTETYAGFDEIQTLLSPGSLRSTLFTLQPLYDGKYLSRVIVWGAGTGTGLGFSRTGAIGQAALGIKWRRIVERYFPKYQIRNLYRAEEWRRPSPRARRIPKGVGPYRRTLNFRLEKKKK
ncbi:MAG: SpoIID/LytB domain-containing protein, partial [Elusimicrobia bacterium]|nr:SpoIID/LytB domain-containing protein [Elusimicrobiota bacterium]